MFRNLAACLALLFFIVFGVAVNAADGPSADVPELKVLDHYAGEWDVAFDSTDFGFTKGEASSKWILDGRYLQTTSSMQSADGAMKLSMSTLMTYDVEKKAYRSWTFVSNGSNSQAESTWDEKTKILTTNGQPDANGLTSKITADFSEKGVEKWIVSIKDQTGNQVFEIKGKNTKRK